MSSGLTALLAPTANWYHDGVSSPARFLPGSWPCLLCLLALSLVTASAVAQDDPPVCPPGVDLTAFPQSQVAPDSKHKAAPGQEAPAIDSRPPDAPAVEETAGSPSRPAAVQMNCEGFVFEAPQEASSPRQVTPPADVSKEASLGRTSAEPTPAVTHGAVIKAILGFVLLLALAYLGGHSKVRELERKLRIAHLVTTGLPFILLGLLASHPRVGILNPEVLDEIRPILLFGLGWIGFAVGFRFESQLLGPLPRGTGALAAATTVIPTAAIVATSGFLFLRAEGSFASGFFLRDALILGTAGAMTAISAPYLLARPSSHGEDTERLWRVVHLEQLAGVVGLTLVAAFFRPQGALVAWQLPGTAWLFITLGLGTMVGAVIYAVLGRVSSGPPFTVAILGSICFAAGIASFLRLSPLAVCFIAGLMLVNFPSGWKERVRADLHRLERPIYFLFLIIAGALWRGTAWQGWALMLVFVASRIGGKWMGVTLFHERRPGDLAPHERRALIFGPVGALAIAIVVSAQDLYYGPTIPWIGTAVIGGAIITEFIVQLASRGPSVEAAPEPDPVSY